LVILQGVFINPALVEPFGLTLIEVTYNPSLNMFDFRFRYLI